MALSSRLQRPGVFHQRQDLPFRRRWEEETIEQIPKKKKPGKWLTGCFGCGSRIAGAKTQLNAHGNSGSVCHPRGYLSSSSGGLIGGCQGCRRRLTSHS